MSRAEAPLREYYDEEARRLTRHEKVPLRVSLHDRLRSMLSELGAIEVFETCQPNPDSDWEFQCAILRV